MHYFSFYSIFLKLIPFFGIPLIIDCFLLKRNSALKVFPFDVPSNFMNKLGSSLINVRINSTKSEIPPSEKASVEDQILGINWDKAINLLKHTKSNAGVDPSVIVHNAALSACERSGEGKRALQIYQNLLEANLMPDKITFIHLMSACEKSFMGEDVRKLYDDLQEINLHPDINIYQILLCSCAKDGNSAYALNILENMRKDMFIDNIPPQAYWNTILACEKEGNFIGAMDCYSKLKQLNDSIPLIVYNNLISICNLSDNWIKALELFEVISSSHLHRPNLQSFNLLLSTLAANGQVKELCRIWNLLLENYPELIPTPLTFQIYLKGLKQSENLEESVSTLNRALSIYGHKVSLLSFIYVLELCQTRKKPKIAISVYYKMKTFPEGVENSQALNILLEILSQEKDWVHLIKIYEESNISKDDFYFDHEKAKLKYDHARKVLNIS